MRKRTIIIVGVVVAVIALIALSSSKPPARPVATSTLDCQGEGSPTVILYTGPESARWDPWTQVRSKISGFTRVCDYHRSKMGTSQQMADGLATLLEKTNMPGPYVLVAYAD